MSTATPMLDAQVTALLRRLTREQETRTRRLHDDAQAQANDILRRARSEARGRVSQAVAEARREGELAVARRRAAIDTRERRARQTTIRRLLEEAWRRLPEALEQRWHTADGRAAWCRAACAQALASLLDLGHVQVEVDPEFAAELATTLKAAFAQAAQFEVVPVAGLGPGLRIRAANASLDATRTGLLAARERVAAELLAEFEQAATPEPGA